MPRSPFQELLGADFAVLPQPVRRLHSLTADLVTEGTADITSPDRLLPWLICRIAGLPASGPKVPVTVAFHVDGRGGELWRRRFAQRRYQSTFSAGGGRHAGLLCERFFPYVFFHKITATSAGLRWELVRCRLLLLPLPRWLMPVAACFESADGDKFVFDVDAAFPLVGPVVHYRGWLLPKTPPD
jgi:hypothetical protein